MGTLDDAIREHLELKRRSGADDDEVSRLENEAFGAARREAAAPAIEAPQEQLEASELPPPPAAVAPEPEPEPKPVASEPAAPAPAPAESWLDDDDDIAEPEVPTAAGPPTTEFTLHDRSAAAGTGSPEEAREAGDAPASEYVAPDEEGDDLLEETPDFLQETPEHDRLWFEQKPPRDFGFDK